MFKMIIRHPQENKEKIQRKKDIQQKKPKRQPIKID